MIKSGRLIHTFPYLLERLQHGHGIRDDPAELPASKKTLWRRAMRPIRLSRQDINLYNILTQNERKSRRTFIHDD